MHKSLNVGGGAGAEYRPTKSLPLTFHPISVLMSWWAGLSTEVSNVENYVLRNKTKKITGNKSWIEKGTDVTIVWREIS